MSADLHILPVPHAPASAEHIGEPLSPEQREQHRKVVVELEALLLEAKRGNVDAIIVGAVLSNGTQRTTVVANGFYINLTAAASRLAHLLNTEALDNQ